MPIQGDTSSSFMPGSGSALSNINFTHSPGYGAGPPPPPTYNSPYSAVGPGDPSAGGNDAGEPDAVEGRLIDIYAAFVHIHWPILAVNKTAAVPPSGNSNAGTSQQAGGHDSTRNSQSLIGYISGLKRTNPILFDAVCAVSGALFESDMDLKQGGFGSGMILPGLQQHSAPSPGAGGSNPDADDVTAAELSRRYAERCRALILPLAHERKLWVVQSLLLIALVDCGAGRMNQAFQLGGMACRLALDMNLHRAESERKAMVGGDEDASDASEGAVTIEDRIMLRRRVFWACYIL
jgi:Fungal specific transcription factor domain